MSDGQPDLRAVLCLGGPAELTAYVVDVRQPCFDVIDGFGFRHRYRLHESKLGPEGWVAEIDETVPLVKVPLTQEQARPA